MTTSRIRRCCGRSCAFPVGGARHEWTAQWAAFRADGRGLDLRWVKRPCVAQLAARAAAQEPPHLRFGLPAAPGGLALQRAERPEVALRVEECFDPCGAHGADQLVLQIVDADVEPEVLHVGARAG